MADTVVAIRNPGDLRGDIQLELMTANLENKFPDLFFCCWTWDNPSKKVLVVTQHVLAYLLPNGIHFLYSSHYTRRWQLQSSRPEDATVCNETDMHALLKKLFDASYPGIEWSHCHEHYFSYTLRVCTKQRCLFIKCAQSTVVYSLKPSQCISNNKEKC